MPYCPSCKESIANGRFCPRDGTQLVEDEPTGQDPMIGQVVADRFEIVGLLGEGGMGKVYEAQHCYIDKRVALKLLRPEITEKPEALTRFQREAMAASTIGHKNIVAIDDFGRLPDGQVYLTMEFLDGLPLNRMLAQGAAPLERILDVGIQTCHGLAAAHTKGIVHRDMKPENIFLVDEGRLVKILDFGIAKVTRSDSDTNLTKTGAVFGTPNYMSPEQALGKKVDQRADIYAMGVIVYEMLTGRVPFQSDSFVAILTQHVTEPPVPPSQVVTDRTIPAAVEALVMRAMAKDPDQRFTDMGEMVAALMEIRKAELGDQPLDSHLSLSHIKPPSSEPLSDRDPSKRVKLDSLTSNRQAQVTATEGEMVQATRPPGKRSSAVVIGLVASVLLLGGSAVLAWIYLGGSGPRTAAVTVTAEPDQGQLARIPDAAPLPVKEVKKVKLLLTSLPAGASILDQQGKQLGKTPESLSVPAGETLVVQLLHEGYKPRHLTIQTRPDQDKVIREVRLERIGKSKHSRRKLRKKKRRRARRGLSDHDDGSDHATQSSPESSHDE
jgi:serine/threonine-protein kinase